MIYLPTLIPSSSLLYPTLPHPHPHPHPPLSLLYPTLTPILSFPFKLPNVIATLTTIQCNTIK